MVIYARYPRHAYLAKNNASIKNNGAIKWLRYASYITAGFILMIDNTFAIL